MIQLDFVLYRFTCDISAFTGLFAEDAEGRHIPDVASFHCTWTHTPRAKPSPSSTAAEHYVNGATDDVHFKGLGTDMALLFPKLAHQLILDGMRDVITFAIRPSQYSAAGPLPVVAKGALDPRPYLGKPMKNYAIKLRDAVGGVVGKLLFSLRVHELDEEGQRAMPSDMVTSTALTSVPRNSPDRAQRAVQQDPSRDRLLKMPPSGEHRVHLASNVVERQEAAPQQTYVATSQRSSPCRQKSRPSQRGVSVVQTMDILLERVAVKTTSIDLDHPAPLLLGGEYHMKIRYGTYTFSTTPAVCTNPKEVVYKEQQASITLQPAGSTEKLRFSLWEGKRQVAGFSLDPAKFKSDVGEWKEYAIPFSYHPTEQRSALDVRVRRVETDCSGFLSDWCAPSQPSPAPTASSTIADIDTTRASRAVTQPSTYDTNPSNWYAEGGARRQTPLRFSPSPNRYVGMNLTRNEGPLAHACSSPSSNRGGFSLPDSITATLGLVPPLNANRTSTPLRAFDPCAESASQVMSGYRGAHVRDASPVHGGWERTPMRPRPPPLTSNLADLPADLRPPNEHEMYIAEVLARLDRQKGTARQQTSLMEDWAGWRNDPERSRCNSVSSMHLRSPSANSATSRADSMASVVSRRAVAPRPTKSNADNSVMLPFTPDTSVYRRRRSLPSSNPFNSLI
ncbi:conserved hypothetical protein [Leishmania braziliensis MHOM/BR/75/M2904]|uniref:Uncharacterized protein n=2 Tax=Leishmania braziliensis TaxID=5660 RepID=A4HQB8_LEIBR|nr:conserved hypothetical protein [Leishmania braziliensis MHOM/BR/75/M2904]CAJ2482194.1 unnamed protein product [Leishmania braziliensis]CAM44383.1 conserved hypothetical protein [Leishmania braziliensis MHOM/BR/75/M2904]SYZ70455.1 bilobe_protein [Leishmania braziliensis MHOM/BR/75/M2904]